MECLDRLTRNEGELLSAFSSLFIDYQCWEDDGVFAQPVGLALWFTEVARIQDEMYGIEEHYRQYDRYRQKQKRQAQRRLNDRMLTWPGSDRVWRMWDKLPSYASRREIVGYTQGLKKLGKLLAQVGRTPGYLIVSGINTLSSALRNKASNLIMYVDFLEPLREFRCDTCGALVEDPGDLVNYEGETYCESCTDSYLFYSELMEDYGRIEDRVRVYTDDESYRDTSPEFATRSWCQDRDYVQACDPSGRSCYVDVDTYAYLREEGELYEGAAPAVIGGYHSSKAVLKSFVGAIKQGPYMGMELEMEAVGTPPNVGARKVLDTLGTIEWHSKKYKYCATERDGSLSNGFEVVTTPCTLDMHRAHLAKLKDCVKGMASHNTSTCGLHVHIDKAGTSPLHRGKMVTFVNDKKNEALVRAVARRYKTEAGYAKIKHAKKLLDGQDKYARDRYEAVNLTNAKTIEFRIFKGTLRYESVMACLEFTRAVWLFTKEAGFNELTTQHFLQWITRSDNMQDTPCLRQILHERKLLTGNRVPMRETSVAPAGEE